MARTKRHDASGAIPMPDTLLGLDGEVSSVTQWPFGRLTRGGAIDVIIHLDKVKAGGKYNARRVYFDGRLYILHARAKGVHAFGKVYLGGWLAWQVWELCTEWNVPDVDTTRLEESLEKSEKTLVRRD